MCENHGWNRGATFYTNPKRRLVDFWKERGATCWFLTRSKPPAWQHGQRQCLRRTPLHWSNFQNCKKSYPSPLLHTFISSPPTSFLPHRSPLPDLLQPRFRLPQWSSSAWSPPLIPPFSITLLGWIPFYSLSFFLLFGWLHVFDYCSSLFWCLIKVCLSYPWMFWMLECFRPPYLVSALLLIYMLMHVHLCLHLSYILHFAS